MLRGGCRQVGTYTRQGDGYVTLPAAPEGKTDYEEECADADAPDWCLYVAECIDEDGFDSCLNGFYGFY
jgi:hypothetical protein